MGLNVLTLEDLQKTTRHDDAIATGCWFLDIHPPEVSVDKPSPVRASSRIPTISRIARSCRNR